MCEKFLCQLSTACTVKTRLGDRYIGLEYVITSHGKITAGNIPNDAVIVR